MDKVGPTAAEAEAAAEAAKAAGAKMADAMDPALRALLHQAVIFLRNPEVAKAPMSQKVVYMQQKLKLSSAGIKVAVAMVYGQQAAAAVATVLPADPPVTGQPLPAAPKLAAAPAATPVKPPRKPWEKKVTRQGSCWTYSTRPLLFPWPYR